MRKRFPVIELKSLGRLFGKTRHAYYNALWRRKEDSFKEEIILKLVVEIRSKQPRIGNRKLQFMLTEKLAAHKIDISRDGLFALLTEHKLLVRKCKKRAIIIDSRHWMRKYGNGRRSLLIEKMLLLNLNKYGLVI